MKVVTKGGYGGKSDPDLPQMKAFGTKRIRLDLVFESGHPAWPTRIENGQAQIG